LLLDAGADANQRNRAGQTALMNAVMFGHGTIVEMLLLAGADPRATDIAGNSPASLASAQGNAAMVDRTDIAALDATGSTEQVGREVQAAPRTVVPGEASVSIAAKPA